MEKNAFSKAFVSENTSVATVVPPKQYVIETKNDNWPVIRNGREKNVMWKRPNSTWVVVEWNAAVKKTLAFLLEKTVFN